MKYKILFAIQILSLSLMAHAEVNPELSSFIRDHITKLDNSVIVSESTNTASEENINDMFFLNTFILRVRGNVGFKIPGLVNFTIIPETEIVWQRSNPDGWVTYKK